jgi:nicotinate-nucleotide--dimethylbenzimidazole phosphoribosyltransferase
MTTDPRGVRPSPEDDLADAIAAVGPLDEGAMAEAAARFDALTKPLGSLGRLEELGVWLAGVTGNASVSVHPRTIVVAVADHGVARQGVSAYPADVTAQMVRNFVAGGAAISVLSRLVHATLVVLDVGVAASADGPPQTTPGARLVRSRVRAGTADISIGPAMSRAEALEAIASGIRLARTEVSGGARLLALGDMGIANTTAASAVASVFLDVAPERVTGRGTGIDDATFANKVAVIKRAIAVNRPDSSDPVGVLAAVGGLEIAALVGLMLGGAAERVPVVLDGFITGAAALVAAALCPALRTRLVASHRSTEPGHGLALDALGLRSLLHLELRLGEGTGAALALPLLDAACRLRDEMATFDSAGVARRCRKRAVCSVPGARVPKAGTN